MTQTQHTQTVGNKGILDAAVEQLTGESIDVIRRSTIWDLRIQSERKAQGRLRFISHFPFIGRGNVMRDRMVDQDTVEREFDAALRRV
jgi:hypothetical protein